MADCFWLSEEQFGRLAPLLPTDTRGVVRVDDRRVISGIVHVLKSGCRWSDAPELYGPHKTLYSLDPHHRHVAASSVAQRRPFPGKGKRYPGQSQVQPSGRGAGGDRPLL